MNIEQANTIPLPEILEKLNLKSKRLGQELVYFSPLRQEKTPSFHVHPKRNVWFDFGEGKGGDVIAFVCAYLKASDEACTVRDALRWLNNMTGYVPKIASVIEYDKPAEKEIKLSLSKVQNLKHPGLISYLKLRGIPSKLAARYLKEAYLYNKQTKKFSYALAFENENGGFELRNPFLKISLKKKGITFIRGKDSKPDAIHFFEGFMDFLSALAHCRLDQFREDAIIFNSLSLMETASPLVRNYGYRLAYTWMDNDAAGQKATAALDAFFKGEEGLRHRPMNELYLPHKDVNAWHMFRLQPC